MTNAALKMIREIAETVSESPAGRMVRDEFHGCKSKGHMVETRTAREMAEVSHNLNRAGDLADEPNGKRWGWSVRLAVWVRYQ